MGRLIGILLVIWLVIGAFAAFQRGYFDDTDTNCSEASDIAPTASRLDSAAMADRNPGQTAHIARCNPCRSTGRSEILRTSCPCRRG